jgi:hypothetical protein
MKTSEAQRRANNKYREANKEKLNALARKKRAEYRALNPIQKKVKKFQTLEEKKLWRRSNRDPIKEAERSREWRYGYGRNAYLESKKNYVKNNIEASREAQRRAYTRRFFKGLDVPKELIEAKHLQLMIERVSKNEKRI